MSLGRGRSDSRKLRMCIGSRGHLTFINSRSILAFIRRRGELRFINRRNMLAFVNSRGVLTSLSLRSRIDDRDELSKSDHGKDEEG